MIVASSSSSLCLPANLARGRLTRLIYVAQHFLQIIVNRPRIRAPDEGEVRVVDVKSVILPRSMAHEPHSLMMNDRCKCGTFQSVFFSIRPDASVRRNSLVAPWVRIVRSSQGPGAQKHRSQFSNFPTAGWPHGVQLSFRVYTRCESTTLVYISVSGYHPRKFRGC
jgi:hypothetical protein